MKNTFNIVNQSLEKVDGLTLACGQPAYVDDLALQHRDIIHVKLLYSSVAHAVIQDIDTSGAEKVPGVIQCLTYKNTPRVLHTTAGQGYPEPSPYDTCMFDRKVRYVGDRVAAVAAETEEAAEKALAQIKVQYDTLTPVFDPEEALQEGAPIIHDEKDAFMPIPAHYEPEKNLSAMVDVHAGDLEKGFEESDFILEKTYQTHYAQHCPIETHKVLTYIDSNNRLIIITSTQVPFHVRRIVSKALQIPAGKIRVIKPRIGGGFGTKQEVFLEYIPGYVSMLTGRPAHLVLSREEEFESSRTRHPQQVKIKVGFNKDGKMNTIFMDVLSNTGAYGSHALTVMSNCGSKTLPLYAFSNLRFRGRTVYTNLPVAGAYRGYGATQAAFALESMVDEIAAELQMDPIELRQKNHIKSGETSPIFEALGEGKEGVPQTVDSCGIDECINTVMREIQWEQKRTEIKQQDTERYKYGIGMALLMQGSSIPQIDMGSAYIKINDDGSFNLQVGATDLGTGSDTVLAQIAAETLGCTLDKIYVYSSDTDMTPFDVGAYASSTTYLSGQAVYKAAYDVRNQILEVARNMTKDQGQDEAFVLKDNHVLTPSGKKVSLEDIALYSLYAKNQFQISGRASHITHKSPPPFAAHGTELEVDTYTGKIRILNYVAAVDCGVAINPVLAEGQTEGAIVNGLSFALTERYIFNNTGKMVNNSFGTYKIFNSKDIPAIKVFLIPTYEESGPYGAKSVSEISINGPIPSIANALYHALGIRFRKAPFTPDKIYEAIKRYNNNEQPKGRGDKSC